MLIYVIGYGEYIFHATRRVSSLLVDCGLFYFGDCGISHQ